MKKDPTTILIYPELEFTGAQIPTPPYSILFIADYLLKRGIDVKTFDLRFNSFNDVAKALKENNVEYIGVSAMTGPQIHYAIEFCRFIKNHFKHIKVVWGGIHPTILPAQTLQNKLVDIVIRGEGEKPFYELISGTPLEDINGLSYKKNQKIYHNQDAKRLSKSEINQQEIPWDLINPANYIKNGNFIIITSRGCPYRCSFCYNSIFDNIWRGWTPEKCIKELDKAIEFGARKITFYDDNFFANSKRVKALFKYFKEKGLIWKAELRVDQLDYSLAKSAKNHGCEQLFFGAESGSQRILNILNKEITPRDIVRSAKIAKLVDIRADYSWMIGIPGEKLKDVKKTIALIKKVKDINPECEFSIKLLYPYPKTVIFSHAKREGFSPPTTLTEWSKIRREQAAEYLEHKNYLEMISIISAIIGRRVFEQQDIPILGLLQYTANLRWKYETFGGGVEAIFWKVFRNLIEKFINKSEGYDPFSDEVIIDTK